jgi:hypothetical protein
MSKVVTVGPAVVWVRIIRVSVHFAVVGALKRRETGISQAQPAANSAAS